MKKQVLACFLLVLCVLFTACEDAKPAETTVAVVTITAPVETTAVVQTTAPIETTVITTTAPVETTVAETTTSPIVEEPGLEYTILQNADGHETGVLFTYPDGSTYQWDCPIESPLPLFVRASTKKHEREAAVVEYYAGDGEWRFDWLDLVDRKLLYRQTDASGYAFVFENDLDKWRLNRINREAHSFRVENGGVTVTVHAESGEPQLEYHLAVPNNDSGIYQNHCIPIKEVIIAETGERIANNSPYTHLYSVAGSSWYLKDGDAFYQDIHYIDGEWRERSEAETRPRLTGFATLYYFEDGVPAPEGKGFYSHDNVSGYDAWLGYEHMPTEKTPDVLSVDWVNIDAHYAVQLVSYTYAPDYSMYASWNSHYFIEHLFYYNADERHADSAKGDLAQQASVLTEHLIRDVMDKTWLEDGYTCTDADISKFLLSLCMYGESTTHPYADIVTVSADQQAYQIRLADAKRIASELFGKENWSAASYPTEVYDSAAACYRLPMGVGLWTSPFAHEDMTAYTAGDLVHVQCTLVNSKLFPYEETIYGKYDFVFRYISDDGKNHLQFAGLEKTK